MSFAQVTDSPQTITVDGQLFESGSSSDPLLDSSVVMRVQVLNPAKSCILYEEQHTFSTLATNGRFNIQVGSNVGDLAKRTGLDSANAMATVFFNRSTAITGKTSGGGGCAYTPASTDVRHFRFFVTPSTVGSTSQLSPDMRVDSVPQALVAQTLQGLGKDDVFKTSVTSTQAKLDNLLTTNYTNITDLIGGTSSMYLRNASTGTLLPTRATDPSTPAAGQLWYDTTANEIKYYNGTAIQSVGAAGAGISSLTAGSGLSGGTITTSGTISIATGGVTNAMLATGIDASKITAGTLPAGVVPTNTDTTKLPLAGGTMTGAITMGAATTFGGFDLLGTGHITMNGQKTITVGRYDSTQETTLISTLNGANAGATWYNNTTNKLMYWNGAAARELAETTTAGGDITAVNTNAGSGLTGGGTSGPITLAINVDNSTIEIATNTVQVKDLGITTAKITDNAVTTAKIADNNVTNAKIASMNITKLTNGAGDYFAYMPAGTECATGQVLKWDAATDRWLCDNDSNVTSHSSLTNLSSDDHTQYVLLAGRTSGQTVNGGALASGNLTLDSTSNGTKGFVVIQPTGGNVGIGTTSPQASMHVVGSSASAVRGIVSEQAGGTTAGLFIARQSNGTVGAPTATLSSQNIGQLRFQGYGSTTFVSGAMVGARAEEDFTDSTAATSLLFNTTSTGAVNTTERMRITSSGNVGIGTTTPLARLDINGSQNIREIASGSAPTPAAGSTFIYADNTSHTLKVSYNGAGYVDLLTTASGAPLVSASSGSAASPSIGFSGDSDTGLYSPSADVIGIAVGGTQRFQATTTTFGSVTTGGGQVTSGTTAGAPSLSFNGDEDTGFYRKAADTIGVALGGSEVASFSVGNGFVANSISASGPIYGGGSNGNLYASSHGSHVGPWQNQNSSTVTARNETQGDTRGTYFRMQVRNAALNDQWGYMGAVANTGAGTYSPSIVIGQQTGATAYAERMRIDSSGNVGIGTSSPGRTLEVTNSSDVSLRLNTSAAVHSGLEIFQNGTYNWGIYNPGGTADLRFYDGTSDRVTFQDGGNVGIGTTTPISLLNPSSTTGAIATLSRNDTTATANDTIGILQFWNNDTQLTTQNIYGNIEVQSAATTSTDAAAGNMIFRTTGSTVAGSPVERMRIDSAGNIGIGTTNPVVALDFNTRTDGVRLPQGTTAEQPTGANGIIRYNTTTNKFEGYENGAWVNFRDPSSNTTATLATGSAAAPSLSFTGETDTGFYSSGINAIGVSAGGSAIFNFDSTGLLSPTTGGGYVLTGNGTAATPTYSFAGDSDTGWFRPAADTIAASTAGVERLRIDSLGNIGVGTTVPVTPIHLKTNSTVVTPAGWDAAGLQTQLSYSPSASYGVDLNRGVMANYSELEIPATNTSNVLGATSSAGYLWNLANNITVGSGGLWGGDFEVWNYGANATISSLNGIYVQAMNHSSATGSTVTNLKGATIFSTARAGTSTNVVGAEVSSEVRSPATVTNMIGLHVPNNFIQAGATVTNRYAVKIDASTGTATNDYAIYQDGASNKNYFAGNVGIGTTVPSAPLHVRFSTASPLIGLQRNNNVTDSASMAFWTAGVNSPSNVSWTLGMPTNSNNFRIRAWDGTSTLDYLDITNTGNVGIGSTSPTTAKLEVLSQAAPSTRYVHLLEHTTSNGASSIFRSDNNGLSAAILMQNLETVSGTLNGLGVATNFTYPSGPPVNGGGFYVAKEQIWTSTASTQDTNFSVYTTTDGLSTEKMRVTSGGNVGIGTTAPAALLHVGAEDSGSGNPTIRIGSNGAGENEGGEIQLTTAADFDTTVNAFIIDAYQDNLRIRRTAVGNDITLDSSGNVGIGSANPGMKLDVVGSFRNTGAVYMTGIAAGSTGNYLCRDGSNQITSGGSCSTSDIRLKQNIAPIENSLEGILSLNGILFDWKESDKWRGENRQMGLIAQEVQKVFPEAITESKQGILGLNYESLMGPIVESIKELYSKFLGHEELLARHNREIASEKTDKADKIETDALRAENIKLKEKNRELELRLERIEKKLQLQKQ